MEIKSCVIMSLYKNDRLDILQQAVESILSQSFSAFHFYIQCDGAIDQSVEEYIDTIEDSRVSVFKRDENMGLAYSLNELLYRILSKKYYEYVYRMDADDISLPERFAKQMAFLEANEEIDCVGTWAIEINAQGGEYFKKKMPITHDECYELFKKRDCFIHPTVAFRRSYFEKAGLYPEDTYFAEDTILWANGFNHGCRFANIPEYLFKFRLDENFFDRRRGCRYAWAIFLLRRRVIKQLNYPFITNVYAVLYVFAKLSPKFLLNLLYKQLR